MRHIPLLSFAPDINIVVSITNVTSTVSDCGPNRKHRKLKDDKSFYAFTQSSRHRILYQLQLSVRIRLGSLFFFPLIFPLPRHNTI